MQSLLKNTPIKKLAQFYASFFVQLVKSGNNLILFVALKVCFFRLE
jgi:hypothetical protein